MIVRELLMVELPPYGDVYRRPLEFHAKSMTNLEEFINTTRFGEHTSPSAINKLASGVLQQSAQPEQASVIANGWQSRRFHFMMAVEHSMHLGGDAKYVDYVSGYTDGVIPFSAFTTNLIDLPPEMEFHISNVMKVVEKTTIDAFGKPMVTAHPADSHNLLTGAYDPVNRDVQFSTRVQDTLTFSSTSRWMGQDAMSNGGMSDEMKDVMRQFNPMDASPIGGGNMSGGEFTPVMNGMDTALCFATERVKPANTATVIPTVYLKKAFEGISSVKTTYENGSHPGDAEMSDIYVEAAQLLMEPSLMQNQTLNPIMREEGFSFSGSVTWATMKKVFSNRVQDVLQLFPAEQIRKNTNANSEFGWDPMNSQSWDVIDMPTIYCSALATMMPAAMTSRMLESFQFVADNYGHPEIGIMPGEWAVAVTSAIPYIKGYDQNIAAQQIRADLVNNILPSMMGGNPNVIMVSGAVNLFLDSQFKIRVDGGHEVPYTMPNFNPSANSPLLNRSRNQVYKLSVDLFNLVDTVTNKGNY